MKLNWQVNDHSGTWEFTPGENRVVVPIPAGEPLLRAEAELSVPLSEKLFFNGYQTWTHSPEYTPLDRIRGMRKILRILTRPLALDHFADYHFVKYPYQRGVLYGFSWCYFRDGSCYRLFASLDEEPGYTMFTYDTDSRILRIERDCIGVAAPDHPFHAFDLFYAEGSEEDVFDQWFEALNIHNRVPKIKGYSSWYNRYQNISEKSIREDLAGACRVFDPGDLFQIDDGWEPRVGDWESTHPKKFPNGLSPIVREIHEHGFKAGLWLAPFVCTKSSGLYRDHPEWLLRYKGKPWLNGPNWGGSVSLDIDHPGFRDHMKRVFQRVFEEWQFDLVKLDFLYAAAPFATGDHGSKADGPFPESRAARMIRALRLLREWCGDKLILGCGVPLMPAFGLVDYCRVGCDVGLDWDDLFFMRILHRERVSTRQSINNTISRRQLDGRAFGLDPDVFFLRDKNIRLSGDEKSYQAALDALLGSMWLTSDDLNAYDEEKIRQYRRLARLAGTAGIRVEPDTLAVRYFLDGKEHILRHPHIT